MAQLDHPIIAWFLDLSSIGIWGQINSLLRGAVWCIVGHLEASLASNHLMPITQVVMTKNVSVLPNVPGGGGRGEWSPKITSS